MAPHDTDKEAPFMHVEHDFLWVQEDEPRTSNVAGYVLISALTALACVIVYVLTR